MCAIKLTVFFKCTGALICAMKAKRTPPPLPLHITDKHNHGYKDIISAFWSHIHLPYLDSFEINLADKFGLAYCTFVKHFHQQIYIGLQDFMF